MSDASSRAPRPATYADIEALPEHLVGEIIGGELIVNPRPEPVVLSASSDLAGLLGRSFRFGIDGPGGWRILKEPELHFGEDILVPDIVGWRVERLPELPKTAYFTVAPDWVCEVLSPRTERVDRLDKSEVYAREGVGHVWLLNPTLRLLEVFRLEGERWVIAGRYGKEDAPVRIEPFEAVPLDLRLIWGGLA